jgi:hypothetical protein
VIFDLMEPPDGSRPSSQWAIKYRSSDLVVELIEVVRRSLLRESWKLKMDISSKVEVWRTWFQHRSHDKEKGVD